MDLYWRRGLKNIFFRNKTFLFFKIEIWNFQFLFQIEFGEPHKVSTHSAYSGNCYFHFFYRLSDSVDTLWGFTKFFFKPILKVSAFYFEKQKSFIPKKYFFWAVVSKQAKIIPKEGASRLNFPEGFGPECHFIQPAILHTFQKVNLLVSSSCIC